MKSVLGVNPVPNPSYTQYKNIAPVAVASGSETSVALLPAIKGGDVAKMISLTCTGVYTRAELVTFTCYRDGAAMTPVYGHDATAAGTQAIHVHWIDTEPGKGEPVYEIVVQGTVGGATTVTNRHASVSNV